MKIFYLTNARLPTEKAHGLATIKLCEALAKEGAGVTVFAPRRINPLKADLYSYYGVERNFKIHYLPSVDLMWLGFGQSFFFLVQLFSFSLIAVSWLFLRYGFWGQLRDTVIFSHDNVPLFFASFIAPKIFYDIHHYPERTFLYHRVLKKSIGLAVQTKWKIQKLRDDFGVPIAKVVYQPNGTDIGRFSINVSSQDARERLGLPLDKKIAVYTGSLERWKGVETLVRASGFLPDNIIVYVVGGSKIEIANFQFSISPPSLKLRRTGNFQTRNVTFVGQKPWSEIPLWLKAADVLVLPNTGKQKVSLFYTSPMKLFEYMASLRPIVASDIPSIREIVDESMTFFAEPDDPQSFSKVITGVLNNPGEARGHATRALEKARLYTWRKRAEKIIGQIKLSRHD